MTAPRPAPRTAARRLHGLLSLTLLIAGLPLAAQQPAAPPEGVEAVWDRLDQLRVVLAGRGPQELSFTQTYVPEGFSSGDVEQGRLAIALPDCLRWDYRNPYPKTYLLCGSEVHAWNPGESVGRRYRIDPDQAPGLDLLRFRVPLLRERYEASSAARDEGTTEILLLPRQEGGEVREARFLLAADGQRLLAIEYEDAEGGHTRFEFGPAQPLGEIEIFSPPEDLRWEGDG